MEVCNWYEDDSTCSWDTDCGNKFQFEDGGPKDNGLAYCPYCGKELVQNYTP